MDGPFSLLLSSIAFRTSLLWAAVVFPFSLLFFSSTHFFIFFLLFSFLESKLILVFRFPSIFCLFFLYFFLQPEAWFLTGLRLARYSGWMSWFCSSSIKPLAMLFSSTAESSAGILQNICCKQWSLISLRKSYFTNWCWNVQTWPYNSNLVKYKLHFLKSSFIIWNTSGILLLMLLILFWSPNVVSPRIKTA